MRTSRFFGWGWLVAAALYGCDDDKATSSIPLDTGNGPELGSDAEAAEDSSPSPTDSAAPDTALPIDATVDTSPDDTAPDVSADTFTADTAPDAGPTDTALPTDTAEPAPDPSATGPFGVNVSSTDSAGFQVDIYRPQTPGKVPAVVLAPGFLLDGPTLGWLGNHLASHGFFVQIVTFGDGAFSAINHTDLADAVVAMVGELSGKAEVDASAIGVGGHSRGGKATLLATTRDSRIKATFGLDPVDAVGPGQSPSAENPSVTPELMGLVKVPLGLVGSEYGGAGTFPGAPICAPTEDNYAAYASAATSASALHTWLIPKSGHNDFADPLGPIASLACLPGDDPAATRARVKTLATAFFKVYLAGDRRYEDAL